MADGKVSLKSLLAFVDSFDVYEKEMVNYELMIKEREEEDDYNPFVEPYFRDMYELHLESCKPVRPKGDVEIARKLRKVYGELKELDGMIGMYGVKDMLAYQIMYIAMDMRQSGDFMHMALYGNPGTGKTTLAKLLGRVYTKMGMLNNSEKWVDKEQVLVTGRENFIGRYLGESQQKTKEVLKEAKGRVLFIDEAYSLGLNDGTSVDCYTREVVDVLVRHLSEGADDFICIIAGYEEDMVHRFFPMNPGLERRFPWKFTISDYYPVDLARIFAYIVERNKYKQEFDQQELVEVIRDHYDYFEQNGGDCEILYSLAKSCRAERLFLKAFEEEECTMEKRAIDLQDVKNGLVKMMNVKGVQKRRILPGSVVSEEVKSKKHKSDDVVPYNLPHCHQQMQVRVLQ
jgi:SpoVK/Ycf46/Vps4 family AAA+-type ATPase